MNYPLHSEHFNELAAALAKAQATMKPAPFNRTNFFKQRYADLNSIIEAAREPLSANGLCVIQQMQPTDAGMMIVARLLHTSGQWMASYYVLPAVTMKAQDFGSHLTYARRYSYAALVGMSADEDDDGEQAKKEGSVHGHAPPKPAPRVVPPKMREQANPQTGEVVPHEIAITGDDEQWGQEFISEVTFAKTDGEVTKWVQANKAMLMGIENDNIKLYKVISGAVTKKREALRQVAGGERQVKPLTFFWDGNVMQPLLRFAKQAQLQFTVGERYRMRPEHNRSVASHNSYFAEIDTKWREIGRYDYFPTPEHLRHYALIQCGYYHERQIELYTDSDAVEVAGFLRNYLTFEEVDHQLNVVIVRTAQSQSRREMGEDDFKESKKHVLEFIARIADEENDDGRVRREDRL